MIRSNVEKIRGMIFTPEELEEIVLPAVEESSSKLFHKNSETRKLVKNCRNQYFVSASASKKSFMLYDALRKMIDADPEKIVSLLNKTLEELGEKDRFIDILNMLKFEIANESSKREVLASIEREMSRFNGDPEQGFFRYKVLDAVYDAIEGNTCVSLVLTGDIWQEDIVTEILDKYRDFVTRRSGSAGIKPYYSIEIVSKEYEGK